MTDTMPSFEEMFADTEIETIDQPTEDKPARTRKPRSDKGIPRGARGARSTGSSRDKKLAEDLLGPWAKSIKVVAVPFPTLAAVMAETGEKATEGIVSLATPKMKEALAKASKAAPILDLAEIIGMMIVAVLLDIQKLNPDAPLVLFSGVRKHFDATHEMHQEVVQDNVSQFPTSPVAGFTPFPGSVG